jgi:hypothetical protein
MKSQNRSVVASDEGNPQAPFGREVPANRYEVRFGDSENILKLIAVRWLHNLWLF